MEKYESLNLPILEHYSLNVKALFDYTLGEVKKDIPHSEDENFDANSVIAIALGKAIKQCGIGDKKYASFEDFKSLYKKAVFGSKKFLHPNTTQMMKNINKCGFALGAIKHSLLSSHLNNIKRYRSEMYETLKSVRNTVSYKEYTKAINKALDLTSDIYHYMIQVYEEYINYCIEVFEKIKKINNEINNSSLYESVTDVANIISPINKSFKNVINSSLNEEVTISESLSTFEQDINLKVNDLCADNKIVLKYFLRTIGPTLLQIKSNTIHYKLTTNFINSMSKKIITLFSLCIALCISSISTSCSKDDDDDNTKKENTNGKDSIPSNTTLDSAKIVESRVLGNSLIQDLENLAAVEKTNSKAGADLIEQIETDIRKYQALGNKEYQDSNKSKSTNFH